MLIIGDVHGKIDSYYKLLHKYKGKSIQAGDFGFKKQHDWHLKYMDSNSHFICFGNHDDTAYLHHPHSLKNFSIIHYGNDNIFTVRGAKSIDRNLRVEGIDWWRNEELSYIEMQEAIDAYLKCKPEIVISHDCPHMVREILFNVSDKDKSSTSNGLQAMLELHQPKLWIFAHWHRSVKINIDKTEFVCLNELETIEI